MVLMDGLYIIGIIIMDTRARTIIIGLQVVKMGQ